MKITVLNIAYHRNGIAGMPFHAIVFRDDGEDASVKIGVLFEQSHHCAVLDVAKLADCDVEFGSNSWRGDQYEPHLRKAAEKFEKAREEGVAQ